MSGRLDGTTVIVTGASSGIGEATARALAAEGATVALLARRRERLEELATELPRSSVHPVDVTDDDALHAAVAAVVEQHGGLDVLVNNAGFGSWGPAAESDVADWRTMIDVNLTGVLSTTHAALPHLATAAGGPRGVADVAAADEAQVRGVRQATQDVGNLVRFDGISLKNCDGGAERGARCGCGASPCARSARRRRAGLEPAVRPACRSAPSAAPWRCAGRTGSG